MPRAQEPSFTIGIEEEYMLVSHETNELVVNPPKELMKRCSEQLGKTVKREFMKNQVEVATPVATEVKEAREHLVHLRRVVGDVAGDYDMAPMAASTHPFSEWQDLEHTNLARYNALAEDIQTPLRRLMIGGMHVHVGIDDDDLRIDLMSQASYFLPHLLALSTSSPFWRGENTGLKSYRLAVFNEVPRTGLPESFDSYAAYKRHVDVLVNCRVIPDATMLWWDLRPAKLFPTLEMRITDVCPRLDDAVCIAALFACLLRYLYRLRCENQRWRRYADMLIKENRWRAERYGLDEGLIDFGIREVVSCHALFEELLEMIDEDMDALNCRDEVLHVRKIVENGTSADRQIRCFEQAMSDGATKEEALRQVVKQLVEETLTI